MDDVASAALSPKEPCLRWETVSEPLLKEIYESDQTIYPAPELTYDRLKTWAAACPELFLSLRCGDEEEIGGPLTMTSGSLLGVIITIPLQKAFWDDLLTNNIKEHDVDSGSMFPPRSKSNVGGREKTEVGLHIFHIERFSGFAAVQKDTRFTEEALQEVHNRIAENFRSWEVIGYSGEYEERQPNSIYGRGARSTLPTFTLFPLEHHS